MLKWSDQTGICRAGSRKIHKRFRLIQNRLSAISARGKQVIIRKYNTGKKLSKTKEAQRISLTSSVTAR
jgi:hypothetical protein